MVVSLLLIAQMSSADVEAHCRHLEDQKREWNGVDKKSYDALVKAATDCWARSRSRSRSTGGSSGAGAACGGRAACGQSLSPSAGGTSNTTNPVDAALNQLQRGLLDLAAQKRQSDKEERERAARERAERLRREEAAREEEEAEEQRYFDRLTREFEVLASDAERPGGEGDLANTCLDPKDSLYFQLVSPTSFSSQCGPVIAEKELRDACLAKIAKNEAVDEQCEQVCREQTIASQAFPASCRRAGQFGLLWEVHKDRLGWGPWEIKIHQPGAFQARSRTFWGSGVLRSGDPGVRPLSAELVFCPEKQAAPNLVGFLGMTSIQFHWVADSCMSAESSGGTCKSHQPPATPLSAGNVRAGTCSLAISVVVDGPVMPSAGSFGVGPFLVKVENGKLSNGY